MKNLHRSQHMSTCLIMLDYGNSFSSNESLSNWTDLALMTFHFHGFTSRVSGVLHYIPDGVCYLFNFLQFAQHRVAFDWKLHEGIQAKDLSSWISKIAFSFCPKMQKGISPAICYCRTFLKVAIHTTVKLRKYFPIVFILNICMYTYIIITIKVKEKKPTKFRIYNS